MNTRKVIKIFILLPFLIALYFSSYSQKSIEWNTQYFGFFDNREYFNKYIEAQTIFGNRLELTSSFRVDSLHQFQVGFNYFYEFGSSIFEAPLLPVINYRFSNSFLDFNIGSFPRYDKLNYPNMMLYDTLIYFRPNIEGSLTNFKFPCGNQKIWIDWTGRQTETRNESFLAGTSGRIKFGSFFIENYFYMYHLAGKTSIDTSFRLRDNGGGTFLAGYESKNELKACIKMGPVFSYDRRRPDPYENKFGFYAQTELEYDRYLIRLSAYNGEELDFPLGDKFYTTSRYTRIDGEISLTKKKNVHVFFQYSLHFVYFEADNAQKFTVRINVNKNKKLKIKI